ncbi:membrane protein [Mycobacterium sp. MFM001]|uniref:nuclear transport factor 2 family protein n=1 Tax=Mycobacterium sp. MFM001 TaxID=2049453 RepID=UPI000DA59CED|nr:nuclear transport factor 2 family protein [Mycobacterium sp. MFM001]GBE65778.1 membrane protein [Mycobacterium sp. MFM001]
MHAFRAAVETGEISTIGKLFTDDVVLHSPVAHRPYIGREAVATIVSAVATVLEGFHFEKEISTDTTALMFRATVDGLDIQGCDFIHTREDGLIDELTVMVRPLKAATVFAEKMSAELGKGERS